MSLLLAIIWTICLALDIADAVAGNAPTWLLVFCPLAVLVLRYWMDYLAEKIDER
jgi:hypothetical protein